jgi:hypothetical protein
MSNRTNSSDTSLSTVGCARTHRISRFLNALQLIASGALGLDSTLQFKESGGTALPRLSATRLSTRLLLDLGFAPGSSPAPGSIRADIFPKGANGDPAVLPGALIVLRGPMTSGIGSGAQGAFAIDGPPPRTYQIEANAQQLYAALALEVSSSRSSTVPVEMNVSAVTSTTSPQLTRLKAMDCAFSRKVHRHA